MPNLDYAWEPSPKVPAATVADWYKTSPFALSAPQTPGLINTATLPQVAPPGTSGSVSTVDVSHYDPAMQPNASWAPVTSGARGYDANTAAGTHWAVDAGQTVEGRLKGILDVGSPLQQQAATHAAEAANGRGLLNSSMAIQAGQGAVIASALPIAQQDAQTFAAAGRHAADTDNSMAQYNTAAKNQAAQFGAQAGNVQTLANQQDVNQAGQARAVQANELQRQTLQQRQQAETANAAAANTATQQDAQRSLTAQTANLGAAVQQSGQQYEQAVKIAMQNTDQAGKLQLQQIDAATRAQLAEMQAKYNVQMQASSSMAGTYQAFMNQLAGVMSNESLDFAGKQAAVNGMTALFDNALGVQANISGLNLGALLGRGTLLGGAAPAAGASDAAPAPAAAPGMVRDAGGRLTYADYNPYAGSGAG